MVRGAYVLLAIGMGSAALPAAAQTVEARPWYVPRHAVLQTAGGIGMVAAGVGYSPGRHPHRLDADLLAGYVPARYTGNKPFGIFTLKATYSPFTLPLGTRWHVQPLSVGALVNYTPAAQISRSRSSQYPEGYYWWSSTVRMGAFVGGRVARQLSVGERAHTTALYYELGTNDLYLVSLLPNTSSLTLGDILTLALGVKVDL